MGTIRNRIRQFLGRFIRSREGNVALIAGVALPVVLLMSAGAIDLHNAARVKTELQDALDAATLAAARSSYTSQADIQRVGMDSMRANMPRYFKGNPGDVATFTLASREQVQATATVQVKTIVANIFLPPYGQLLDDYLPMSANSDVLRASRNVEVAMALDITGSMKSYMSDLKSAAKELVGIVVQGDQQIYTTRVALVPYAAGVNVGTLADAMRGEMIGTTDITAAGWSDPVKSISGVSSSTFTSNGHGLKVNDRILLTGFSSSTLNEKVHTVRTVPNSNTFTIQTSFSSSSGSSRSFYRCWETNCNVVVTSDQHGLKTGDYVRISGVRGMTDLNGDFKATKVSDSQFSVPLKGYGTSAYQRNGTAQCGYDGCKIRLFDSQGGVLRELSPSTCVTERPYRSGTSTPSDVEPSSSTRTNLVGRMYPRSGNPCPSAALTPLTNVVNGNGGLNALIDSYVDGGSTAGQIGVEQAWYAISPNFGTIFPSASRPNAFDTSKTVKAVILMTDGDFNTPYCQGVISQDAVDNGNAGEVNYQINCGSTNGSVFTQSVATCTAMKSQNIVVYTVGFNLGTSKGGAGIDTAYEVMEACASSKDHFFPAATGTDLKEAFKSIGRDITRLRIAR